MVEQFSICNLLYALLDVGRSCILVSLGGKCVMLDCGMHMGYNDSVSITSCSACVCSFKCWDFRDASQISHSSQTPVD